MAAVHAARILVVAATPGELAWVEGAEALVCGVGPVEAAAATARRLAAGDVDALLHVGIAGACRGAGLALRDLVVGSASRYEDLRARFPGLVVDVAPAPALVAALGVALPAAQLLPIGTSAAVGGTAGCPVEAMEGFGVLRAAQLAGVPAVELRAISNEIEEDDRARWDIPGALAAVAGAGPRAVAALRAG